MSRAAEVAMTLVKLFENHVDELRRLPSIEAEQQLRSRAGIQWPRIRRAWDLAGHLLRESDWKGIMEYQARGQSNMVRELLEQKLRHALYDDDDATMQLFHLIRSPLTAIESEYDERYRTTPDLATRVETSIPSDRAGRWPEAPPNQDDAKMPGAQDTTHAEATLVLPTPEAASAPAELIGDRYRIIAPLGAGGQAETFLAEDLHLPSRPRLVIKKLTLQASTDQAISAARARFAEEARVLETLGDHSQIPRLYQYFHAGANTFIVQEFISGPDLHTLVRLQGVLPEVKAIRVVLSVLDVLVFIHSRNVIHRDVKPQNIILRSQDERAVLIDFGVMKEVASIVFDAQEHALPTAIVGTPGYMPYEQVAGRPTFASDQFSLAWTLLFLISGKHPNQLHDPATDGVRWEAMEAQVSGGLRSIVERALEQRPRDRFESAAEMKASLQALIAPSPMVVEMPLSVAANGSSLTRPGNDFRLPDALVDKGIRYNLHKLVFSGPKSRLGYNLHVSPGTDDRSALEIEFHFPKSEVGIEQLQSRLKLECENGDLSWLKSVEGEWEIDADALRAAVPALAAFEWLTGRGRTIARIAFNTSGTYPPHEGKSVVGFLLKEDPATGVWSAKV